MTRNDERAQGFILVSDCNPLEFEGRWVFYVNMLFGNKEIFAIDISPPLIGQMGFIYIWINRKKIGDGEETYIKQKLKSLRKIKDLSTIAELDIGAHTSNAILRLILATDDLYDKTLIGLGMGFDSYLLRTYIYKGTVVILWVYIEKRGAELNLSKVTVECESVSLEVYEQTVDEFGYWLDQGEF